MTDTALTAQDADGDEFVVDFAFPSVSTAKPARPRADVDSVEARLAGQAVSAGYELESFERRLQRAGGRR